MRSNPIGVKIEDIPCTQEIGFHFELLKLSVDGSHRDFSETLKGSGLSFARRALFHDSVKCGFACVAFSPGGGENSLHRCDIYGPKTLLIL